MLGKLSPQEIEQLLLEETVGRIGCIFHGRPHIFPVSYVYDGARIICHSAEGTKLRAMRAQPNVCFEVDRVRALNEWRSVVVRGRFEELHGPEAAGAMSLFVERLRPLLTDAVAPGHGIHAVTPHGRARSQAEATIYCLHLRDKQGRFESPD
jgi:nitroimidazol reductase NimA-like FMN-containing flavoprotein (pyridoxamine 5'-phosphate oxidase superfamily)